MYLITNGKMVTENGIFEGYDLLINEDKISQIDISGCVFKDKNTEIIDANGGFVSPGIIDIHSDYIEHMAAPRPTSLIDFQLSIREAEKELITHGITTMYHSLSLYKHSDFGIKHIRQPENVKKLIDLIDGIHEKKHLIRHRFHARFEIDNIDEVNSLKKYIKDKKIHLLSFMDHTPGQGQFKDFAIYRETLIGYNFDDYEIERIIKHHQSKELLNIDTINDLANLARENNIAIASHDDDSIEKLNLVKDFGTRISEFPITLEIAKKAKQMGLFTTAGAPNILLGGSHSGNLSAAEAILNGSIDILCSDYYPPALLHSIFAMNEKYGIDLYKMFNLITINPAKAVNIDNEYGSIKIGKKADLIIIEKIENDFPVITSAFVDGKQILNINYRI